MHGILFNLERIELTHANGPGSVPFRFFRRVFFHLICAVEGAVPEKHGILLLALLLLLLFGQHISVYSCLQELRLYACLSLY